MSAKSRVSLFVRFCLHLAKQALFFAGFSLTNVGAALVKGDNHLMHMIACGNALRISAVRAAPEFNLRLVGRAGPATSLKHKVLR